MRSLLYGFTERAVYQDGKKLARWEPNRRKIGDLQEALSAIVILSDEFEQSCRRPKPRSAEDSRSWSASRQANGDPPHSEESRCEGAVFVPRARGFVYWWPSSTASVVRSADSGA